MADLPNDNDTQEQTNLEAAPAEAAAAQEAPEVVATATRERGPAKTPKIERNVWDEEEYSPEEYEAIILKCLQKKQDDRYYLLFHIPNFLPFRIHSIRKSVRSRCCELMAR